MNFNKIKNGNRNILIGCHLLNTELISKVPKSTIILNTEQIHSDDTAWNSNIFEWVKHFEVWDYSPRNIEKLNMLGVSNAKHLRIGFQKELKRIPKPLTKDIDVLFYGSRNERRNKIIEELQANGLKVEVLFGVYGSERDKFISRSKVVLNHHFYRSEIFEIVRVFYLLCNEVAVVGEVNETTFIEDWWKEAVCGAPYGQLVNQCIRLTKDDLERCAFEKKGFELIKSHPQVQYTSEILTS